MVGNRRFGKRRGWMRSALRQKKGQCVFFQPLIFYFFSYLPPQTCVNLSNQMHI
ncbi:hypothetical protein HMPREF0083_05206 [Aneurinibacillus aneurinilyticus ATCC 12856]|uniref:Uncharacterized protein n=1 Tax=Aneurinibacillus aneurinilyticus ATCC 12856 TaxID=649747 RepID=U1WVL8_ANEAE|nr:hypothetical protein HMPREF0083_05206 [Aneurinibacillus aneurinilyticus ATCC 12856]